MHLRATVRFRRRRLPHWEVARGRYFVTVRLADSLPHEAVLRFQEIHRAISSIEPHSALFRHLQRQHFRTLEKFCDAGTGACLLRDPRLSRLVADELGALAEWQVDCPHYTIMPNHWHALIVPGDKCTHSLSDIMKRIKGRSGLKIRKAAGGNGEVWQAEWFDHWIRSDAEWERTVSYIRENPVKAGLVKRWSDHHATQ